MSIKTWAFVNLLSGSKAIKELLPQKTLIDKNKIRNCIFILEVPLEIREKSSDDVPRYLSDKGGPDFDEFEKFLPGHPSLIPFHLQCRSTG